MKVTIVAPTYNEAENVGRFADEVHAALSAIDYELLIADDNSPDGTWLIAQELTTTNPRIRVLRRITDHGVSRAVIEGILSSAGEYVAVMDADLQHDPAILPQMIAALDAGAEIAVGSRYITGGGTGKWNAIRRFESWLATKSAHFSLGVKLKDPMSGYFVLRRSDFDRIETQLNSGSFNKILLEIIARLAPSRLEEVPYTFRTRAAGRSKLSAKWVFRYLKQLWRLSSSRYISARFLKFAIVGASGTAINLCAFLLFARLLGLRDWRISALATLLANLTNYVFNNAWTFGDRVHRGWSLLRGYVSYFSFSLVGMSMTTLAFAGLNRAYRIYMQNGQSAKESYILVLGFQLAAILVGTFFNYELNKRFTWGETRFGKVQ